MKYAIIECINGNYFIRAEGITDIATAKTQFHGRAQTLWNAPDVITGEVAVVDEQLDVYHGCKELIRHEPQPEPEG